MYKPFRPGQKVGELRRHLKLPMKDVADVMSVSVPTISHYSSSSRNVNPSPDKIERLASAYGIDVAWFYDGLPPEESPVKMRGEASASVGPGLRVDASISVAVQSQSITLSRDEAKALRAELERILRVIEGS